jgi:hypothetical protein
MGATTPSRIRCKNCKTRLRPNKDIMPVLIVLLVPACFIAFILGFVLTTQYLDGQIAMFDVIMTLMIVALPLIIIAEVIFSLFLVNKSGLFVNEVQ